MLSPTSTVCGTPVVLGLTQLGRNLFNFSFGVDVVIVGIDQGSDAAIDHQVGKFLPAVIDIDLSEASSTEPAASDAVGKIEKAMTMANRILRNRFFMLFLQKWAEKNRAPGSMAFGFTAFFFDLFWKLKKRYTHVYRLAAVILVTAAYLTWMLYSVRWKMPSL